MLIGIASSNYEGEWRVKKKSPNREMREMKHKLRIVMDLKIDVTLGW